MKMKRCRHFWISKVAELNRHVDLSPGGINYWVPNLSVEVCVKCHKVRNVKKSRRTGKR